MLLYFGLSTLAWSSPPIRYGDGLLFVLAAIIFVLGCEVFMFGFQVELSPDELVYRSRGVPFPKTTRVRRSQILRAKYEAAVRTDGKPWKFVEIESESPGGKVATMINLTAFSTLGVKTILDWMPRLDR